EPHLCGPPAEHNGQHQNEHESYPWVHRADCHASTKHSCHPVEFVRPESQSREGRIQKCDRRKPVDHAFGDTKPGNSLIRCLHPCARWDRSGRSGRTFPKYLPRARKSRSTSLVLSRAGGSMEVWDPWVGHISAARTIP